MSAPLLTLDVPPGSSRGRAASRVRSRLMVSILTLVGSVAVIVALIASLAALEDSLGVQGTALVAFQVLFVAMAVSSLAILVPAAQAIRHALAARRLAPSGDDLAARTESEQATSWCWFGLGMIITVGFVAFVVFLLGTEDGVIRSTYFNGEIIKDFLPSLWKGLKYNITLFLVAEVIILVWGLVIALLRMMPGRAGAPVRFLATAYTDLLRGLPAVVTIYLLVFGLQTANLPLLRDMDGDRLLFWLACIALVLVYGAYVSEVYRAGLDSIHWSQVAAARSLGLSQTKTMRHVVVPQAVRRIIPPLLNDFIALQKDTALVSFVGVLEVFNRARINSSRVANLSPVVAAGVAFVIITIPLARLTDYLIRRDQARMRAGG